MMVMHVMTVEARINQRYSNGRETTFRRKIGPGWTELSELRGLDRDAGALAPCPAAGAEDAGRAPPRVEVTDVLLTERTLPSRAFADLLEKYNLHTTVPSITALRRRRRTRRKIRFSIDC